VQQSSQLVTSLLQHMSPQLGQLQPNELAGSLWALHKLRQQPPEGWLEELFEASAGSLSSLRADEVAVLIRGLAGVQVSMVHDVGNSSITQVSPGPSVLCSVVWVHLSASAAANSWTGFCQRCSIAAADSLAPSGACCCCCCQSQPPPEAWLPSLLAHQGYPNTTC
jgi:hypothetical protein